MKRVTAVLIFATFALAAETPQELFEKALVKERSEGNLKEAIQLYQRAAASAGKDRALAAKALIEEGECYRKLGDAEARKLFERVVRDYSDQKEAVALARARLGGAAEPQRQTNTLVWSGRMVEEEGTVSPDGRSISYVDWDTGDLALHEIATGADRHLTNKGTWKDSNDFAEDSAISRDGKQVAYNWFKSKDNRTEVRVGNLEGDFKPRAIYDSPDVNWITPYDWSPDGKSIVVEIERKDRTKQIGLIAVSDGAVRVLKTIDWRGCRRIFFSPDGRYIGYDLPESETSQQRDVFVLQIDGAREIHAVAHRGDDIMMGWSADGKWLLFASDRMGSMGLWGLPFSGGQPQGAPQLLKSDLVAGAESIGVTRSGTLYYGTSHAQSRGRIQIATFDFTSGRFLSAPTDLPQDYSASNQQAQWSPDGKRLAYVSQHPHWENNNFAIVIRSMDTGEIRELHPKLSQLFLPRWAPDGRSFMALGRDFKGGHGIYRIDVNTGDVSPLILDPPDQVTDGTGVWSPDGNSIYIPRHYRESHELAFVQRDLASGKERVIIRRRLLGGPNLSPDGKYIATPSVDEASNSRTFLLIPVSGGEPREVMRVPSEVPAQDLRDNTKGVWLRNGPWAPDSRSFLALKLRGPWPEQESEELWSIPIDGGAPRKLEQLSVAPHLTGGGFSVHRDGHRIAFTSAEATPQRGEIWALEHFLPPAR